MELQLSQRVPPAATLTDLNANQTWCGAPGNVSEKENAPAAATVRTSSGSCACGSVPA